MKLVFLYLLATAALWATPLVIDVSARSAILMNGKTGAILFEKDAHAIGYPASTTKIATALFVLEQGHDLSQLATVSSDSLRERPIKDRYQYPPYWIDTDGPILMGLKKGEKLPLEVLLYGAMLLSGNDAANVIAESVGGSIPCFMDMLNEYLQSIGCQKTQLRNPHGLHHPDHWSTAYDLALIGKRALQHPRFRQIISTRTYPKPKTNKQPESELKLTNPLLKPESRYYYSKAIGGKTGATSAAQKTMVAFAEHDGRTLIAVVLGCPTSESRFGDIRRMFDAAFAERQASRRLMGAENIFTKELVGAKSLLKASLLKPLSISYFPSEEPQCKAVLHWDAGHLPIRKGQKVGEVHIQDEHNTILQRADLIALEEVKGTFFFTLKQKWRLHRS